jgi:GDP-4-dehydro-6-deoxy-D-mannose reductase
MPRALVTGVGGFVGPFLANHLKSLGYEVTGTFFPSGSDQPSICPSLPLDVRNSGPVRELVRDVCPDVIYHLAGITRPGLNQVSSFYHVNLLGSLNMIEAARDVGAAMLIVSSAYIYGNQNRPLTEEDPLAPVNHYAASKAAIDLAALSYALEGLQVVRVRPFNHSGPGQSPNFLIPTLVQQVAKIEAGIVRPVLKLGNVDSVRDFSDVRDIVRAYALVMQAGESGEAYNVASGVGVAVHQLVEMLIDLVGVSVEIEVEPRRVRASDISYLVGDASKLKRAVGWRPEFGLRQTLVDMLEHERKLLRP